MILKAARALVGADLEVAEPGVIAIQDGHIAAPEPSGPAAEVLELPDVTLLPGFIDSHVHIGFADPLAVLRGGVTTVRDLAWPPEDIFPLAAASREPHFPGPAITCVGQMLTVADGYPTKAAWAPPGTGLAVGSAAAASAAVAAQADAGAVAIKVGLNAEVGPTLDPPVLRAICDAAHERGLDVTAHIYGLNELTKALAHGVDELAHILMSPERIPDDVVAEMIERGIVVVPTLSIFSGSALSIAVDNVSRFVAAGGRVVYGTDLGNAGPRPGIDPREIAGLMEAGLDGRAVIASATTAVDGPASRDRGVLAAGFSADIIGVRGDPLTQPLDLCEVDFVMRGGRVVLGPKEP